MFLQFCNLSQHHQCTKKKRGHVYLPALTDLRDAAVAYPARFVASGSDSGYEEGEQYNAEDEAGAEVAHDAVFELFRRGVTLLWLIFLEWEELQVTRDPRS